MFFAFAITLFSFSIGSLIVFFFNSRLKQEYKFFLTASQLSSYLIFGIIFYIIMSVSMFKGFQYTKGAGYSDLPFHLSLIHSFSIGCNIKHEGFLKLKTPFYSNISLSYPFIPNFHAGFLMSGGATHSRNALFIPSWLIICSMLMGLYSLIFHFSHQHFQSLIGLILFLNLGGLGWTYAFDSNHRKDPRRDWIEDWGNNQHEYWLHPLMHILIPQRSALWGLSISFWCLLCLRIALLEKNKKILFFSGLLASCLPQVHIHSFVAVCQYALIYCLINFDFSNLKFEIMFWFWLIVALIPSIFQLFPYISRVSEEKINFFQINPIWNRYQKFGLKFAPLILWWRGLGIFSVISLLFGWFFFKFQSN